MLIKTQQHYLKRIQQSRIIWSYSKKDCSAVSRSEQRTSWQNLQNCERFWTFKKTEFIKKCAVTLLINTNRWQYSMVKSKRSDILTAVLPRFKSSGMTLCLWVHRFWGFEVMLQPEDESTLIFQNFRIYLPNDTTLGK